MKLTFADFKGEIPRLHPRLLPETAAQLAVNTRLESGALVPLNASKLAKTLPISSASMYRRSDGRWLSWAAQGVKAVPGPVASLRTYITGDGVPKIVANIDAGQSYNLALYPPAAPLVAVPIGTADPDTSETVVFSYTYLTILEEESQPAALSNEVVIDATQSVTLSGYPDLTTATALARGIRWIRFYRSQTDALGVTTLYFVFQQLVSTLGATFTFDPATMQLAEVCPSVDYNPPVDDLSGIVSMPNGIMVAFSGKDIYFSEPYRPHAWPIKYSLSVDYSVIGLASIGSSVVVMTAGTPYTIQGTTPGSMVQEKVEKNLPCVSALGIADLGYAVAYPSTEGLVVVSNSSADLVTRQLFTRQQWDAMNAETIVAGQHIGRYVFAYTPDGASGPVVGIIDLTGVQPFYMRSEEAFIAVFYDIGLGTLWTLVNDTDVHRWDDLTAPKLSQTWRSRLVNLPSPTNFGCIMVETDDLGTEESFAVDVFADGALVRTTTARNKIDRLPSNFLAERWEVQFRGSARVTSIRIANVPDELTQ